MEYYVTQQNIDEKTRKWLSQIDPSFRRNMNINVEKSALLVIDMQDFFLDPSSPTFTCGGAAILPNVKKLITSFREKNLPVIYTRHVHHPEGIGVHPVISIKKEYPLSL